MNNGERIASRVRAGLARGGERTGDGVVVITIARDGAIDDTTFPPTRSEATTTTTTAMIADYSARDRDGTIVQIADRKLLIAVPLDGFVPSSGDKVTVAGVTMRIVSVKASAPGGVPLLYTAQVRA